MTKGKKRKIKHKIKQTFSAQSLGRQRSRPRSLSKIFLFRGHSEALFLGR